MQYENVILEAVAKPNQSYNARVNEEIRKIREALVTGEIENLRALSNKDGVDEINILNRICAKHNTDFNNYKPNTQKRIREGVWFYFHPTTQQNVATEEAATSSEDFKAKLKSIIDQNGGVLFSHQVDGLDI